MQKRRLQQIAYELGYKSVTSLLNFLGWVENDPLLQEIKF